MCSAKKRPKLIEKSQKVSLTESIKILFSSHKIITVRNILRITIDNQSNFNRKYQTKIAEDITIVQFIYMSFAFSIFFVCEMVCLVLIITNGAKMRLVQRELEQTEYIWRIMNICTDLFLLPLTFYKLISALNIFSIPCPSISFIVQTNVITNISNQSNKIDNCTLILLM